MVNALRKVISERETLCCRVPHKTFTEFLKSQVKQVLSCLFFIIIINFWTFYWIICFQELFVSNVGFSGFSGFWVCNNVTIINICTTFTVYITLFFLKKILWTIITTTVKFSNLIGQEVLINFFNHSRSDSSAAVHLRFVSIPFFYM